MSINHRSTPTAFVSRHIASMTLPICICLGLSLVACGGGKTPAAETTAAPASPTPAPVPTGSTPTMKEQLAELEKQGVLPKLDRSSDIAGPDANRNGIRDDIDAYIAALPVSDAIKKAARQVARVQQKSLLIDLKDRAALLALSDSSMASTACMSQTAEAGLPLEQHSGARRDGHAIILRIEAITANTAQRADRYMAYMGALHGTTTTYPTGKVCEDE